MAERSAPNRLGRGLSSLLGDYTETRDTPPPPGTPETLPVEALQPRANQPRQHFDEAALDELAASIAEHGILQPLLVRKTGDEIYEIIAGERRWRAAQRARLHEVPVRILDLTDQATLEAAIIENVQRTDLNPLEEAKGYQALMEAFNHTQESLAKVVGKSRSHLANMIRLLALPERVQDGVRAGQLSMGHARALLGAQNPAALAETVIAKDLSVRATEQLVRQSQEPAGSDSGAAARRGEPAEGSGDPDARALAADLSAALGLEVQVKDKAGKGDLILRYGSYEQLDELVRRLMDRR